MSRQQVLIRVDDELGSWLDSQSEELGISKPQLVIALLKARMTSDVPVSSDIVPDIKPDGGVSKDELEEKLTDIKTDINQDINELSISLTLINNDVGDIKGKVNDIKSNVSDINDINADILKRLEILEQLVASKPKRGRPPKNPIKDPLTPILDSE